jgi:hypothetical protein
MNGAESDAAVKAVVDTLRYFTWLGPTANEVLTSTANDVELRGVDPDCCPVCEEIICDSSCPLQPYRKP